MKELTKEIRKEIKELIEKLGSTDKILNLDIINLEHKMMDKYNISQYSDEWFELKTTINNQINYFKYSKGM